MNFLNPAWLFALGAICIPIAIHLWNIRAGKTLKVGSISIITEASSARSRSFKLTDVLLLLLRCLLLTAIALLLAAPIWRTTPVKSNVKGWILVPKNSFKDAYQNYRRKLDSLQKAGYQLHWFDKDFAVIDTNQLLKLKTEFTTIDTLDYWQLLSKLTDKLPPTLPVELFTPNTINHFHGNKLGTALHVNWHTYLPSDSVKTWLSSAWLTAAGNIKVVKGNSKPGGISYQYFNIKSVSSSDQDFNVSVTNGQPFINIKNDSLKLAIDTTTLHMAIYAGNNTADAAYVKAALNAIARFTERKIVVRLYYNINEISRNNNWLFWLSNQKAPLDKADNILFYASGKAVQTATWFSTFPGERIPIYRIIQPTKENGALWSDGFGRAILSNYTSRGKNLYALNTRFNPVWTDLVWDDKFPSILMTLILPAKDVPQLKDLRSLSTQQITPIKINATTSYHVAEHYTSLQNVGWLIAALLLFVERWLAHRTKLQTTNG